MFITYDIDSPTSEHRKLYRSDYYIAYLKDDPKFMFDENIINIKMAGFKG